MQKALVFGLMLVISTPALAAWVGDVSNVAPANTVRIQHADLTVDPTDYSNPIDAYAAAVSGDTLLMGPGFYTFTHTAGQPWPPANGQHWTKNIHLIGSGSDADPASNTVWTGATDANGFPTAGHFMQLANQVGSTVKDFRMQNIYGGAAIYVRDWLETNNRDLVSSNWVFDNLAFINCGQGDSIDGDNGFCDLIQIGRSTNNVSVTNSLFDGDGFDANGDPFVFNNGSFGFRFGNYGIENTNTLIQGNTFQNLRAGVGLAGYRSSGTRILNNVFDNISEYPGLDDRNSWGGGGAGVYFYPRRSQFREGCEFTTAPWIKDVVISGNTFSDIGVLADEATNVDPHPWTDTLIHDAGIGFTVAYNMLVENVMIRNNTFIENAGDDGVMKRAINIVVSDANDYRLDVFLDQVWTGIPGVLKDIVVDTNTYTNVNAIRAIQWSGFQVVDYLGQPDLYVKNANGAVITGINQLGDVDNDGDIDAYDITNLNEDLNGDGYINDDDKVYLLTVALKTKVGDFNLDGLVDGLDFLKWQTGFNQPGAEDYSQGNCTGGGGVWDSDTDGLDFLKWQAAFPTASNFFYPSGAAVPEPATLALLALGGLAALRRRR